jgi:hypothetical protein
MQTFFHGWRRKAGVAMLIMACVFAAGWTRSCFLSDDICFTLCGRGFDFNSEFCRMGFGVFWPDQRKDISPYFNRVSYGKKLSDIDYRSDCTFMGWSWYEGGTGKVGAKTIQWTIPYWTPAITLTLLSAYLILWKPRKRSSPN